MKIKENDEIQDHLNEVPPSNEKKEQLKPKNEKKLHDIEDDDFTEDLVILEEKSILIGFLGIIFVLFLYFDH